jgi:uncharacterized damage-inducible protein DinB
MHPQLGTVTLRQLLALWVVHDLDHLGQIAGVMAHRSTESAGVRKPYMGILNR